VITGAGAGLGMRLAERFVADGERVVLLGRTYAKVEALAERLGNQALALHCDVASPDSVRAAFAAIAERCGAIDALINNAAVFEPSLVAAASDDHILRTIGANLTGAIFCTRAAIPLLARGGHIINVTSESIEAPFAQLAIYQASKAGLERFSLSLQQELAEDGVRVTIVRAGQMMEAGKNWDVDPATLAQFVQANIARGLNLMTRPGSQFTSVTGVFRALVDLPADVHVAAVHLHGRAA
jgi:NAD(P)-dependent dehydrogenase (short-subunit alcohol dehydrogenase family)